MIGYVDADHAGNHATGYTFALNGTAVTGLSTREAEYVAAKEALWLRTFLRELGFQGDRCSSTRVEVGREQRISSSN